MGEAKRRGTAEERKQQALQRKEERKEQALRRQIEASRDNPNRSTRVRTNRPSNAVMAALIASTAMMGVDYVE